MTTSDWIQSVLAVIAGVGAIFAFWNINVSKKSIDIQLKQWQFQQVPIFRIIRVTGDEESTILVIENVNHVFHRIEKVSFSNDEVKVDSYFNGTIENSRKRKNEIISREEYKGIVVTLIPKTDKFSVGSLQIVGFDSLGNKFISNTVDIKFSNKKLKNHFDITMTYLKNI